MFVYMVIREFDDWDGSSGESVECVFATNELAVKYIDKMEKLGMDDGGEFYVNKVRVRRSVR